MTIFFCNKEPIDLNAIAIMGVSVKSGNNPIGYFGTGLKFAIATLLRTGHEVKLHRNGEEIKFYTIEQDIRGESFNRVVMGSLGKPAEMLGFTTALGRNWEPWQAYRELRSNLIDEGGVVIQAKNLEPWAGAEHGTIFEINGDAIESCHLNRRDIFLESSPLFVNNCAAIHGGKTDKGFYRGVRCRDMPRASLFTYNVVTKMELTEDRTVKWEHLFDHYVKDAIGECDNELMVEEILLAPKGSYEHALDYSGFGGHPSPAFMAVCERNRHNYDCNVSAIHLWRKHSYKPEQLDQAELDAFDQQSLDLALELLKRIACPIERSDFTVVNGLGPKVWACVRAGQIVLSKSVFDMGHRFIASTLYEEWLHKNEGLADCTRELQNLLFEKLLSVTERLVMLEKQ